MKTQRWEDWSDRTDVRTTVQGPFFGIAIGPDSDEGLVTVNGELLQAGRVLALRGDSYSVRRVVDATSATRLSLVLFECASELALEVARANGHYIGEAVAGPISDGVVLTVPFLGRRHALVSLKADEPTITGYSVDGRLYLRDGSGSRTHTLAEETITADSLAAFHIGGTNEAEPWHELVIRATTSGGNVTAVVETLGEAGAR